MPNTATRTLAEFLLSRIANDEEIAKAAIRGEPVALDWKRDGQAVMGADDGRWAKSRWSHDAERIEGRGITIYDEGGHTAEQATHIAAWDPARVLAECEAKRRIVELHRSVPTESEGVYLDGSTGPRTVEPECDMCGVNGAYSTDPLAGCETLALLAQPYADHPDFRQEWRANA